MRVTVYFLVRLITLYGLSAAAVQSRPYPNVLELNRIYDHFDPKEVEAAYSITPIEHPLTEPSYVKHLAGFNVHGTDKSQEAPEIQSSASSEEKNSQRTWSTTGAAVTFVKNSRELNSLENNSAPTKTSNEDLSIAPQLSSAENFSRSRKPRENRSQENAVNNQEGSKNTMVKNQMQNNDKRKEENLTAIKGVNIPVQHQQKSYHNSANSNEQKSISNEENLVTINKQVTSTVSQETSNENSNFKRQQTQYSTNAEKSSQETWEQRNNKQKLNNDQRKRNLSGQFLTNSREEQTNSDSNEQGSQSYENRSELKNQEKNSYVWSSSNRRGNRNKHQEHRHVKRSQNLLNSQEEQSNLRYRSNLRGQKKQQQNYDSSEEIQIPVSNMNILQYEQFIENLRNQRQNKQQGQENTPYKREQAGYHSYEEKSQESASSEEQRDQTSEHKKGQRYQPSVKVSRKPIQYSANSNEGMLSQTNSKSSNQYNRTPKYVTEYSQENNKQDYRKAKKNKEYPKNNYNDISVEDSEEAMTDSILQKTFDHYYPKDNVMVPFVVSMRSPMSMNVRKIFMMSKSYKNNPLDYQTASSDYIHGFHTSEDMVRFHETLEENMKQNKQAKMNSTELITMNHYAVKEHNVTTEDGYILQMIRLSSSQDSQNAKEKPVVFLMHGFLGSSDDWLLMGPKKALAYLLADAGYDVWLGNARGNKYSRHHISKNPEQPEFWKFSNDEIALTDLPAMIDYALNTTQQKQLFYVGFSQGNAQFFALASTRPEYNAKIKIMYALSPMSFMKNSQSMLVKMFAPENPLAELIEKYMQTHTKTGEFKFQDKFLSLAGKDICMATVGCNKVCSNINFIMSGVNVEQLEPEMAAMILGHTPARGSLRQMIQLGQATEDFRMFDYGQQINQEVYGTSEPPSYNVKLVTAPVAMFSSKDDWLAATEDVEKLEAELPNVIKNYKIKNNYFTNLDFIFGKMATEMYKNIIKSMGGFEKIGL